MIELDDLFGELPVMTPYRAHPLDLRAWPGLGWVNSPTPGPSTPTPTDAAAVLQELGADRHAAYAARCVGLPPPPASRTRSATTRRPSHRSGRVPDSERTARIVARVAEHLRTLQQAPTTAWACYSYALVISWTAISSGRSAVPARDSLQSQSMTSGSGTKERTMSMISS
jgi:hypothetical protein